MGGTTRSFALLVRDLTQRRIAIDIISTNRWRLPGELIINAIDTLARCAIKVPRAELVMLNANPRGAVVLGPLIYLYSRLWRRPFVFRMFGGDLIEVYERLPPWAQRLFRRTVLNSDLVLLQTQRLIDYFTPLSPRIQWLPTAREPHSTRRPTGPYRNRLVYIGSIRQSKGVDWVLRFAREHADTYEVHLYGPIAEPRYATLTQDPCYRGLVAPDQVVQTLSQYDVLLLPTEHPGEGYPGVVIEANSVGLPVVATRWLSLPELVIDQVTGTLTPSGDYAAFAAALLAIDDSTYQRWSEAAWLQAQKYCTTEVNTKLLGQLKQLCRA
jgi:glycosyltransferase involved in cell wall biosynthesis